MMQNTYTVRFLITMIILNRFNYNNQLSMIFIMIIVWHFVRAMCMRISNVHVHTNRERNYDRSIRCIDVHAFGAHTRSYKYRIICELFRFK